MKPLSKLGGQYCKTCQLTVNRGEGGCLGCGKDKQYLLKKEKLCYYCYANRSAPKGIREYVETVSIPDEYNRTLFHRLVALIDWEVADEIMRRRFKAFGNFLQTHTFDGPLTWETIFRLKSELSGRRFHYVRRCLQQLGELLLNSSKDETLEECKKRVRPLIPIASLEGDAVAVLRKYELWLRNERKNGPLGRRAHFDTLAGFWKWCAIRGLKSFATVEAAHVNEYLHILGLKWRCRHCSVTKNLTSRGETSPVVCENPKCCALYSYEKVIRCADRTIRKCAGTLRVFFGWLTDVERGIEINPAPPIDCRKSGTRKRWSRRAYSLTIQYYDWAVISALLKAVEDPNMPADEAMALYLILYHAFYVKELKTVQIPTQCRPVMLGLEPPESLAVVLSLEWQTRELSRGRQFLGRTGDKLQLEPRDEPWLTDLVKRFVHERNQKLRDPNNRYLFVGESYRPPCATAGALYFRRLIPRATTRVTGRICTANILGKCSRILFAEFGGHEGFRHLRELGLGEHQARSYAWAKRVRVIPKQVNRNQKNGSNQHRSNLIVPLIDVFGIPTDL
jgi:hypothetical protein